MNLTKIIFIAVCCCLFFSCKNGETKDSSRTPYLEVDGRYLYMDELENLVPQGSSKEDSTLIVSEYVRKWVTEVLMYNQAKRNISNEEEIDRLVEEYRKTLVIHQYQQNLVKENLGKDLSDSVMQDFYNQNKSKFTLNNAVIKGVYIKVPVGAAHYSDLQGWFVYYNAKSVQNIENYSVKNAVSYEYFGDKWVYLFDIIKNTPIKVEDQNNFVATNKYIEVKDSAFCYLMRITAALPSGGIEPYEMAKSEIQTILTNKQRIEFIRNLENKMYQDAVDDNKIKYFNKND